MSRFAFLNERSFSWVEVIGILLVFTIFLVGCHLGYHLLHEYWWDGHLEYWWDGRLPKFIAVYPRDPWSIPAIILSNFFHSDTGHLISNLMFFWVFGLWAFKQEKSEVLQGILYGAVFAGVATWLFGTAGSVHLGFSGVVFALVGILIISSIRIGCITIIVFMCLAVYIGLIVSGGAPTLWPSDLTNQYADILSYLRGAPTLWPSDFTEGVPWLGHLGGLIGGMYSQIKSPRHALRILAEKELVTPKEAKAINSRMPDDRLPPPDIDEESDNAGK